MVEPAVSSALVSRKRRRFDLRRDGGRVLAGLGVVLLINLVFWYWFVRPRQSQIAELQQQKATADSNLLENRKKLANLERVQNHVASIEAFIERFYDEDLSTRPKRLTSFQRAIFTMGRKYKAVPEGSSSTRQDLEKEGLQGYQFVFPVEAGYENLRKLIADFEALDQFIVIRQIQLNSGREGGRRLQLGVEIETFFSEPGLRERLEEERRAKRTQRGRSYSKRRGGRS